MAELEIDWDYLLERLERLIDLGEAYLSRSVEHDEPDPDLFARAAAFRWQSDSLGGEGLRPLVAPDYQALDGLVGLQPQVESIRSNTRHFVSATPAHHVLIRGGRGMGKTALVRGLLPEFVSAGLRIVEIRSDQLQDVEKLALWLQDVPLYFVLLCEDVDLHENSPGYQALLTLLNGGMVRCPQNVCVYATMATDSDGGEGHCEAIISEYFGVRLRVTEINEAAYLEIVHGFVDQYGLDRLDEIGEQAALRWGQQCRFLSGRVAEQFVVHYAGQQAMAPPAGIEP
ncbi:MAG: DUF815 domain-containing protein [Desulfuromonas sp.]|nr:DUF815 domain-containing protein [Desulfuromonas sp.]